MDAQGDATYSKQIGAAERVSPGIRSTQASLIGTYKKWDTALSKGSLGRPSGAKNEHLFPARYYAKTEAEKAFQLHTEATKEFGKQFDDKSNVRVQAQLPDQYVKWLETKQQAEFMVQFDKYIEEKYLADGDLAKRDFVKLHYPQYYEAREAHVKARQELDKLIFDIKLRGPQNMEEIELEYLILSGLIIPDTKPIWDSSAPSTDATLERGFLSAKKWLPTSWKSAYTDKQPWDARNFKSGTGTGYVGSGAVHNTKLVSMLGKPNSNFKTPSTGTFF